MTRVNGSADYVFQKIAQKLPAGYSLTTGNKKQEAREWFRDQARNVTAVDANKFMSRADDSRKRYTLTVTEIGKMYMFWYDAKLKDKLPYWDRLPLIFPIEMYNDGFLGINLHYLPMVYRAQLMDAIYRTMANRKYDRTTALKIRYSILKGATRYKAFEPCIKRYLSTHVRSSYVQIMPTEWDMALMLPTERFVKAKKQQVWVQSTQKIRKRTT